MPDDHGDSPTDPKEQGPRPCAKTLAGAPEPSDIGARRGADGALGFANTSAAARRGDFGESRSGGTRLCARQGLQ